MDSAPMKTVTILLTRYSDWFGKFISAISKNRYSHASISIDEDEEIFYSFNEKGFAVEKPKKRMPKCRIPGSVSIRIKVPENVHALMREEIEKFLAVREQYKYAKLGVTLCLFHIPCKFKEKYFCSQFVAEILAKAGAVTLKKKESLYLPGQLLDGIECLFSEKEIAYSAV